MGGVVTWDFLTNSCPSFGEQHNKKKWYASFQWRIQVFIPYFKNCLIGKSISTGSPQIGADRGAGC
jgi:hypothetical protein